MLRIRYSMQRFYRVLALALCITMFYFCFAVAQPKQKLNKFIHYGWDAPNPSFLNKNIQQMEKRPFDGVIIRLKAGKKVFLHKPYNSKDFTQDIESLKTTKFSKFTDNFLVMWATTDKGWDWFSESDWKASEYNLRLFAKTAHNGRLVGIAFDPETYEPYGANPWLYPSLPQAKEKSFEEYKQQVRKRGAQFIQAIQQELPGIKLLTLFQLSQFVELDRESLPDFSKNNYGLFPAFVNGMLDAVNPKTLIIDGNEDAYYSESKKDFFWGYNLIRELALALVDPKNKTKYTRQVQVGQAVYIDELFALRQPQKSFISYYLTPQQRAKWLEHNTYYALATSDEYVWCYSEQTNWWKNKIASGVEEAIRSAQKKIKNKKPLGFSIEKMIKRAKNMRDEKNI